jgi:glyoxylase-like metal-dependent hydrolase (beta-lactamase superfamily II)
MTPWGITRSETDDALGDYLASLEKVYAFDISLVLPGHRRLIRNCRGRIDELKQHHRNRLDEVLSILENGSKTAYDVASGMTWDIDYKSFDLFPVMQKWFATGEAMAHLRYHEEKKIIQREIRDNRAFFSVTG